MKCVERAFGDLFARFHILCTQGRSWFSDDMGTVVQACASLHNMIVEARKNFSARDGAGGVRGQNEVGTNFSFSV
jgi:Plant transposon protein